VVETTRRAGIEGPDRLLLDLSRIGSNWEPPSSLSTAFICAAVSVMLPCEQDPVGSRRVNVTGTLAVCEPLVRRGVHVVFLSTNQVFDGSVAHRRADDATCPTSEYGRQRAEVEATLLALPGVVTVVRFGKLFEPGDPLLLGWVRDLRGGREIHPFADLVLAPLSVRFAVEVLLRVADRGVRGIVQASADRDVNYADVARHLAQRVGAPAELVQPTTSLSAGLPQHCIPKHATLDTSRLRDELGLKPPDVWATIDEVLEL